MEVLKLLSQAERQLGRLDMYSECVPDIELFISMHVMKEATQSSRIEGTRTRVEEALLDREDVPSEKRDDWEEVHNYIQAMDRAEASLDELPFSSRLIRKTHRVLMQGYVANTSGRANSARARTGSGVPTLTTPRSSRLWIQVSPS